MKDKSSSKLLAGVVAALTVIGVGTGIAFAAGGDSDKPLQGNAADRATAAALDHVGGGTVTEAESGDDGAAYSVEVRRDDGSHVEVALDESFNVVQSKPDDDGSGDDGAETGSDEASGASAPQSHIDPGDFVDRIDNRYFPLEPGTVFRMRTKTQDGIEHEVVTVTDRTKDILGVSTRVVKDVVRLKGELTEFTHDWYAQDKDGNVWYFGEDTAEYENGKVISRHGSWEAGVDGARAGIIINADPQVTDSYRQEFYRGEAEDMFWVVGRGGSESVPYGHFNDVVHTLEWTRLEPKIVAEKYYAPGVGIIAERSLSGPKEVGELVGVTRP